MKRTPRVVIPPPMQERQKSTVCRREQRVRRRRAPTLRKPFFCRNKPHTGLFRHSHSGRRVMIPPPHMEMPKKCEMEVFITAPNRVPAETQRSGFGGKRTSDRESESCRLRRDEGFVVRSGDGGRRPASHLSGLRRSRCPAKRTGRGMAPHPQAAGRSPHSPSCERFCGNAFTRLRRRSFKGGPVPL